MFGIGKFFKQARKVARVTGAPLLKEAYLLWRVYPKLPMFWEEWIAYRTLGKDTFSRQYLRKARYCRWGFSVNPQELRYLLQDKKVTFDRLGPEFMGRPYCATDEATAEEILAFWDQHKTLFQKARAGTCGAGIALLPAGLSEAERRAKVAGLQGKSYLLEPYIQPHPALKEVIPDALSSLRIHTIRHGEDVRLCLLNYFRFGRKGGVSDHVSTRYLFFLNLSGKAFLPNAFSEGREVEVHADTGYRFENFELPDWEKSVELVKRAALRFPEIPFIGWDIALTPTGPLVIEANFLSGMPPAEQGFLRRMGFDSELKPKLLAMRRFARTGQVTRALGW